MPHAIPGPVSLEPRLRAALGELERRLESGLLSGAEELRETFPDVWADADATLELVYAEYVGRARRGERPPRDDWYRRFPALRERLERLFAIYDLAADLPAEETNPSLLDTAPHPPGEPVSIAHLGGYEVLEEIGRGGMGIVYKARQLGPNRVVALKMLRGGAFARPEDADRIRREAEAVGRLRHPNIVQIHAVGDADGVPFLCLEYVAGGSLEDALARLQRPGRPTIPAADAAALVETIARAMHAAHGHGVVHRDLKPSNILLEKVEGGRRKEESAPEPGSHSPFVLLHSTFRHPKVTDFGLAAIAEGPGDMTRTGAVVGTPCYMAPEQAAADRSAIGPRTDVYALGGILYQLLAGRPPFEGATALETVELVRTTEPIPPRRLRPGLPRDLETICLTCLRKEPGRRYATAAALADDLGRFGRGEPIRARPVSAVERGIKWARRRPAVAALGAVVVALVGVSFGLLWTKYAAAEDARRTEERQNLDLVRALAAERLALARSQWQGNEVAAARATLAEVPEAHRGPDWAAFRAECHAELASVRIPNEFIGRVVAAPEPGRVALYYHQGPAVLLAEAMTGRTVATVPVPFYTKVVAFTPEGDLVAVPNVSPPARDLYRQRLRREPSDQVIVWDFAKRQVTARWKLVSTPLVVIDGSGTWLAGCWLTQIWVAEVRTAVPLTDLPSNEVVRMVEVDGRGRRLAAFVPKAIELWDVPGRRRLGTVRVPTDSAHGAFSPAGDLFLWWSSIRDPNQPANDLVWQIVGYDVDGGYERFRITQTTVREMVAFAPDGSVFASAHQGVIFLYDSRTGRRLATLRGHSASVSDFAISRDGSRLYSVGSNFVLKTWDITPWVPGPGQISEANP